MNHVVDFLLPSTPGSATQRFFLTSAFWLLVGVSFGFLGALNMVAPDLLPALAQLSFGRVRPTHINLVIFGFLTVRFLRRVALRGAHRLPHATLLGTAGQLRRLVLEPGRARHRLRAPARLHPGPRVRRAAVDSRHRRAGRHPPAHHPGVRHHRAPAGEAALRQRLVHRRRPGLVVLRLRHGQRGLGSGARLVAGHERPDPDVVLRPQRRGPGGHPAGRGPGLLHPAARHPAAVVEPHPVALRLLGAHRDVHAHGHAPPAAGAGAAVAEGALHRQLHRAPHPGLRLPDQRVAAHQGPLRPHLRERGRQVRVHGNRVVLPDLPAGAVPIATLGAEDHPLHPMGRRPRPPGPARLRRLHRRGRGLLHPAAGHRPQALLDAPGRHALLAHAHRHHRDLRRR